MSGIIGTNSSRGSGSIGTAASGATISASDPAIDTNPDGGIGTQWANSTSGEFYVLTDATAGANVWTNVGDGTGNIVPWAYQGSNYGYTAGGYTPSAVDTIDKFSLSSDAGATDVGDLLGAYGNISGVGCSGETYGFSMGGQGYLDVIQKNAFASDGDSTDVGDLDEGSRNGVGSNNSSYGYCSGGQASAGGGTAGTDVKNKFAMASTADASDIGNLTQTRTQSGGGSDPVGGYGYVCGGGTSNGTRYDVIDRNSFSSDGDSTDVGDMTSAAYRHGGASSVTHGFTTGGEESPSGTYIDSIQKYAFASSGNASDIADISGLYGSMSGQSTDSHGYWSGGGHSTAWLNEIEKYTTASDANSTDVGDLTVARKTGCGFHY